MSEYFQQYSNVQYVQTQHQAETLVCLHYKQFMRCCIRPHSLTLKYKHKRWQVFWNIATCPPSAVSAHYMTLTWQVLVLCRQSHGSSAIQSNKIFLLFISSCHSFKPLQWINKLGNHTWKTNPTEGEPAIIGNFPPPAGTWGVSDDICTSGHQLYQQKLRVLVFKFSCFGLIKC